MSSFSIGDLAHTFMLQRRGAALKADMTRLNEEVATGLVADVKSVLDGNVSHLTQIEVDLKTLTGYRVATSEAAQFSDAMQTALERMDTGISTLGTALATLSDSASGPVLDQFSADARAELATLVSALNTTSAGRSLFAGNATDKAALADVDVILDGLRAATAGAGTPQDILAAAELWFDDPAGFAAVAYTGSGTDMDAFRLGDGETVSLRVTADNKIFRDLLKDVSVAAIASDAGSAMGAEDRRFLLSETGRGLLSSQTGLTAVRANVGSAQARIDALATRNSTEETALLYAKGALLQADPFEAATELEAVQFQLQSLYAITARMSEMSFVNFIR